MLNFIACKHLNYGLYRTERNLKRKIKGGSAVYRDKRLQRTNRTQDIILLTIAGYEMPEKFFSAIKKITFNL